MATGHQLWQELGDGSIRLFLAGPPCPPYSVLNNKKRKVPGYQPFLTPEGQVFESLARCIRNWPYFEEVREDTNCD